MTREEAAKEIIRVLQKPATSTGVGTGGSRFEQALCLAVDALRQPDWVRTADRLPLNLENELVVIDGKITLGLYDHNCWFFYNEDKNEWQMDEYDRVTHWMHLPKLPEVEG